MLALQSIPMVAHGVVSRDADGEVVIVHARTGKVTVINHVGAFIWHCIDGKHTVQEIVEAVVRTFDVSAGRAREDTLAFLQTLADKNLITLSGTNVE
nr:PqqD family protein [Ardenticatena sp.]